jgi:hypothetical protein
MTARVLADALPATPREAELQALRLGSAGLEAAIAQVTELLVRGQLDASHPWPAALVWRRVRDSRDVAALATDRMLAPLLEAPGADAVLRVAEAVSGLPQFGEMADALQPDRSDYLRPNGSESALELIARHAGRTVTEVEREARRRRSRDAVPARGVEATYHCPSGAHSWLGKRGVEAERCPYCGAHPIRWERFLLHPNASRRGLQQRRRRIAAYEARFDGTPPPHTGRGRQPGSENRRTRERRSALKARLGEQEPTALVHEHAARFGVSTRTAWRDYQAVH